MATWNQRKKLKGQVHSYLATVLAPCCSIQMIPVYCYNVDLWITSNVIVHDNSLPAFSNNNAISMTLPDPVVCYHWVASITNVHTSPLHTTYIIVENVALSFFCHSHTRCTACPDSVVSEKNTILINAVAHIWYTCSKILTQTLRPKIANFF